MATDDHAPPHLVAALPIPEQVTLEETADSLTISFPGRKIFNPELGMLVVLASGAGLTSGLFFLAFLGAFYASTEELLRSADAAWLVLSTLLLLLPPLALVLARRSVRVVIARTPKELRVQRVPGTTVHLPVRGLQRLVYEESTPPRRLVAHYEGGATRVVLPRVVDRRLGNFLALRLGLPPQAPAPQEPDAAQRRIKGTITTSGTT